MGVRQKSLRLAGPEAWGEGSTAKQALILHSTWKQKEKDMVVPLSCSCAVLSPRVLYQKTPALEDWPETPRLMSACAHPARLGPDELGPVPAGRL